MRHTVADTSRGSSASHDLLTSCCTSNSLHSTGPEFKNVLDRNEAQIPSELISHCVATLLMIQVNLMWWSLYYVQIDQLLNWFPRVCFKVCNVMCCFDKLKIAQPLLDNLLVYFVQHT